MRWRNRLRSRSYRRADTHGSQTHCDGKYKGSRRRGAKYGPNRPILARGAILLYRQSSYGQSQPRYRTEILSRWTEKNLYFLFVCPYEVLNLKPSPDSSSETFQLWDWDVAEVFIGSDFQNIRRYHRALHFRTYPLSSHSSNKTLE